MDRARASFLIRCWLEPSSGGDGSPRVRGYIRNLATGEESFLADAGACGEQILRQLSEGGQSGRGGQ